MLTYSRPDVRNNKNNVAAIFHGAFKLALSAFDMCIEGVKLRPQNLFDSLAEFQSVFLIKVSGGLELTLDEIEGLGWSEVVGCVDPVIVKIINDSFCAVRGGNARHLSQQASERECAECSREILPELLICRFRLIQERRKMWNIIVL